MDFPQIDVPKVVYVGPMVMDNRDKQQQTIDSEFLDIFESRQNKGNKIIYCSVSTLNNGDLGFIKKVIEAVKGQSNWFLIVSLGGKLKKSDFMKVPGNVFIKEWVPQLEVLKNTDCSINHAGINTINECIHFEVPMLVYSGKRHDQNGCAARVVYHRMGLIGNKDLDTNDDIRTKISTILKNPEYRNRMKEIGKKYKKVKRSCLSEQLYL
nr:nucleotide disphospho-sugar-binding domain-containing protein [Pseudozobellia sp. WGM2]